MLEKYARCSNTDAAKEAVTRAYNDVNIVFFDDFVNVLDGCPLSTNL